MGLNEITDASDPRQISRPLGSMYLSIILFVAYSVLRKGFGSAVKGMN